jgi:hypothetical protein
MKITTISRLRRTAPAHRSSIKIKEGGKNENPHKKVWASYVQIVQQQKY